MRTEQERLRRWWGWKWGIVLFMGNMMSIIYLLINRFPQPQAKLLPLTWLDHNVPLLVSSIWIYWGALFFATGVPLVLDSTRHFFDHFHANATSFLVNVTIWLTFPAKIHRAPLSLPSGLSESLYSMTVQLDSPLTSFPSGHVSLMLLAGWTIWRNDFKHRWLWIIFAFFGAFSVLTTKQHVSLDMLAGLFSALIGISFAWTWRRFWRPSRLEEHVSSLEPHHA